MELTQTQDDVKNKLRHLYDIWQVENETTSKVALSLSQGRYGICANTLVHVAQAGMTSKMAEKEFYGFRDAIFMLGGRECAIWLAFDEELKEHEEYLATLKGAA